MNGTNVGSVASRGGLARTGDLPAPNRALFHLSYTPCLRWYYLTRLGTVILPNLVNIEMVIRNHGQSQEIETARASGALAVVTMHGTRPFGVRTLT